MNWALSDANVYVSNLFLVALALVISKTVFHSVPLTETSTVKSLALAAPYHWISIPLIVYTWPKLISTHWGSTPWTDSQRFKSLFTLSNTLSGVLTSLIDVEAFAVVFPFKITLVLVSSFSYNLT